MRRTGLACGALGLWMALSTGAMAFDDGGRAGGMASGGHGYAKNRAIVVKQTGTGPAFDNAAYEAALDILKELMAQQKIAVIRSLEFPEQSSAGFCVQVKDSLPIDEFAEIRTAFEQIKPAIGQVVARFALTCD